ncbi:MAG TPA: DNA repair protein RecN [Mycobacteriales bacterium]|nr:DNA repair protein RecN [Mycobacteriales bacterium]
MLEEMRIRGLGVIDDAVLELGSGLTVVTGETGAGKTMLIHGLALLAGGRGDPGLVRPGADRAIVEGRFCVPPGGPAQVRAVEAGGELEDGVLLVSRTVAAEGGRSRAHVGGRAVPLTALVEVTSTLVALHGQHDQQRIVLGVEQRAMLDRYAGDDLAGPLAVYRATWARWRAALKELEEITELRRERTQEADLLRLGIADIAGVAPQVGEDAELAVEVAKLGHADSLSAAAGAAHAALTGDPVDSTSVDAFERVSSALHALAPAAGLDPDLDALAARVNELSHLLADCAADLASYAATVEADPQRLAAAQARQAVLATLTRRYADNLLGVAAWSDRAIARLLELDRDEDRLAELRTEAADLESELGLLAAELSQRRRVAASRLAAQVTLELTDLALPHAAFDVEVSSAPTDEGGLLVSGVRLAATRDGIDDVELRLAPHPGAPSRPIARGASGGELSRVMLGLEVVLAGADPVPTMVFDEVDAGVGGRAAVEVGRRLARLAQSHQVVVVTHLPQVAAFADRHLLVVKSDDGRVTASDVTVLSDSARVRELSRMLAGLEDTDAAREHVEELLAVAAAAKAEAAGAAVARGAGNAVPSSGRLQS